MKNLHSKMAKFMLTILIVSYMDHICVAEKYYYGSRSSHRTIPTDIPTDTTHLELQRNRISEIPDNQFDGYNVLVDATFANNRITLVSSLAFCDTRISELSLNGNELSTFPDVTCIASTLTKLDLINNDIPTVDASLLTPLASLSTLSLNYNKLTTAPDMTFKRAVGIFQIAFNDFPADITSDLWKVENVKRLTIGGSLIMPDFTILTNSKMQALHFIDVDVTSMPEEVFSTLGSLTAITYESCAFSSLPVVAGSTKAQIAALTLMTNANHVLTNAELSGYSNLRTLTVEYYYHLTQVPVLTVPSLMEVYLDYNGITGYVSASTIKRLLQGSSSLSILSLQDNAITGIGDISDAICAVDRSVTMINLLNNPLQCTCEINWMNSLSSECTEVQLPNPACSSSEGLDLNSLTPCAITTAVAPDAEIYTNGKHCINTGC